MLYLLLSAALCLGLFLPLYFGMKIRKPALSIAAKVLSTCCPLALAIWAASAGGGKLWMAAVAIGLCAIADAVLELHFVLGMGAFICGHFWFILWFTARMPLTATHLPVFALMVMLGAGINYLWWKDIGKERALPFAIYAVILGAMVTCGVMCLLDRTAAGWITALGAAMFMVSDMMVGKETITRCSKTFEVITMLLYEGAQFAFAVSAMLLAGLL